MSLATDLLELAKDLPDINVGRGRPSQAKLRRSMSTAYYSLFSLLVKDAATVMVGSGDNQNAIALRSYVMRAMSHKAIREVCKGFANRNPSYKIKEALGSHDIPEDLVDVATICHDLQYWRHEADYNLIRIFAKSDAKDAYEKAEEAHRKWQAIKKDDQARKVFLVALVIYTLVQTSGTTIQKP